MAREHWFDLRTGRESPEQLACNRRAALDAAKTFGRVRLDAQASSFEGYGIVASVHAIDRNHLIVQLDSLDEAIAFVAEANGETEADVEATARAHAEYLHNLRTGKKAPATGLGQQKE